MTDLVERLRTDVLWHRRRCNETIASDCEEAAAEIERLRADAALVRAAALEEAARLIDQTWQKTPAEYASAIRAASVSADKSRLSG